MKVLHLGKYYSPYRGGIENHMKALINKQHESKFSVSAIVHDHLLFRGTQTETINGARIVRVSTQLIAAFVPVSFFFLFWLVKEVRNNKPDIIHVHMPNVSAFYLLLKFVRLDAKIVVHWHSDVIGDKPAFVVKLLYPIYRFFERLVLEIADSIIATSPCYAESSVSLKNWQSKVDIIPLAIEPQVNPPMPAIFNPKKDTLRLLCIGRLSYYKGHIFLLQALESLVRSGRHIHLDIVGDGPLFRELSRTVIERKLKGVVDFHRGLDDSALKALICNSHLVCLPSIERTEAFGLVLLEAMRDARPCIVTDVYGSGMSYVIQDNYNGYVVRSADAKELARTIERFIFEPRLIEELGQNGYKRFIKEFELNRILQQFNDVYQRVL